MTWIVVIYIILGITFAMRYGIDADSYLRTDADVGIGMLLVFFFWPVYAIYTGSSMFVRFLGRIVR